MGTLCSEDVAIMHSGVHVRGKSPSQNTRPRFVVIVIGMIYRRRQAIGIGHFPSSDSVSFALSADCYRLSALESEFDGILYRVNR